MSHDNSLLSTRTLAVDASRIGDFSFSDSSHPWLNDWQLAPRDDTSDASHLKEAATLLQTTDIPVAFPTETVYGLGADATRSEAVRGIYQAKDRPSDNPLIVHVCSLNQLRSLLRPSTKDGESRREENSGVHGNGYRDEEEIEDPIPAIYQPLIQTLWPGPLTIILPNPSDSILAPEVTGGLNTFAARIPDHPLALALIKLAEVPLAAPSANASTKPSPTTAEHVKDDLDGRIGVILDGGPCSVGVESTVVDGLSDPPSILRPGGTTIEQLRQFKGWESVVVAYKDEAQMKARPKAPGMKYRHYSPKAKVVLFESGSHPPSFIWSRNNIDHSQRVGVIRTRIWPAQMICDLVNPMSDLQEREKTDHGETTGITNGSVLESYPPIPRLSFQGRANNDRKSVPSSSLPKQPSSSPSAPINAATNLNPTSTSLSSLNGTSNPNNQDKTLGKGHQRTPESSNKIEEIWDVSLGSSTKEIARGIFSALRELDRRAVDVILVEGIEDTEEDLAAAIMNRLRKAASSSVVAVVTS